MKRLINFIKKYLKKCRNLLTFIFVYKLKFLFLKKNYAVFFCGNATIGDNVILLSLVEPFLKSNSNYKKVYYFGNEKNINLLEPLYGDISERIVWKKIKSKKFSYLVDNPTILSRIVNYCNCHKKRMFHSIFYLQERIPKNYSVIEYHKKKMKINQNEKVFLPKINKSKKERIAVINVESQSISTKRIKDIAENTINFFNKEGIKVFVNSKTTDLKGDYSLVYPPLLEFLNLIESSLCFVSIRSGITDLACSTSTNIIAIYGDKIWNNFSLDMWPKKDNRKIIEVTDNDFSNNLLKDIIS